MIHNQPLSLEEALPPEQLHKVIQHITSDDFVVILDITMEIEHHIIVLSCETNILFYYKYFLIIFLSKCCKSVTYYFVL